MTTAAVPAGSLAPQEHSPSSLARASGNLSEFLRGTHRQALSPVPAQTFGFRLPFVPDFLADHTLLEEEPHKRIVEHSRRWTQFVANLWVDFAVTYALVYRWLPDAGGEPAEGVGQVAILLVASAASEHLDQARTTVRGGLLSLGCEPVELTQEELLALAPPADVEISEVRQRDERVQLDPLVLQRLYIEDMRERLGETEANTYAYQLVQHGIYAVLPWWGPGGSFLSAVQHLTAQPEPVSVWVLLRPVSLNQVADDRGWLLEWSRSLSRFAEESGTQGISYTVNKSSAQTETTGTTTSQGRTLTQSTNWSETLSVPRFLLSGSRSYGRGGGTSVGETEQHGSSSSRGRTESEGLSYTVGNRTLNHRDPQARWLAELVSAQFQRLHTPFLAAAYVLGPSNAVSYHVASAISSAISEEEPFDPPEVSEGQRRSSAQVTTLGSDLKARALEAIRQIWLDPMELQTSSAQVMRPGDPSFAFGRIDPKILNYLVDAKGAATVFRLPVNVRGGIVGIEVRQRSPGWHPGPVARCAPPGSLVLGDQDQGGVAHVPAEAFTKHALITGFTGSGKTETVLGLLHQFWTNPNLRVPFLVIESAKQEYRGLHGVEGFQGHDNLLIYTLGNETCAPFRFNPFELLPGVRVEAHIGKLQTCFEGALPPIGPLASLIYEALYLIYRQQGWMLTDRGPQQPGQRQFPTMSDFAAKMEWLIGARGYAGEVRNNLTAAIAGRVKPLTMGSRGRMFDCQRSTPSAAELLRRPVVLELNDLNQEDKALVVMFLLTVLREQREIDPAQHGELKHITVVEEAHNVLENVKSTGNAEGGSADTRYKAVQAFCNLLAEVRALGEGLIIADQSPEKLAPDAMRNTNVQIAHQLRDGHDRDAIANAMVMDEEQRDFLGKLQPGRAALFVTGLEKATFVQMRRYRPGREGASPGDGETEAAWRERVGRQFPGVGFRAFDDDEIAAYMAPLTSAYKRPDHPLASCQECHAELCHLDGAIGLLRDGKLLARVATAMAPNQAEASGQPVTIHQVIAGLGPIGLDAAERLGRTGDTDAAWCFVTHAVHRVRASRSTNYDPEQHSWGKQCRQQFEGVCAASRLQRQMGSEEA